MKIQHISDTHGFHKEIRIEEVDVVIHSGDATNSRNRFINQNELISFAEWYGDLPNKHKIYIAGNHCTALSENKREAKAILKSNSIIYLEEEAIEIEGVLFYGTPYTPSFGNWSFMRERGSMYKTWEQVPKEVQVLITHGPPKGLLDTTENRDYTMELVGDKSIHNYFDSWTNLKYLCCGHIHNFKNIINTGLRSHKHFYVSNAAAVEDGRFDKGIIFHGNILSL